MRRRVVGPAMAGTLLAAFAAAFRKAVGKEPNNTEIRRALEMVNPFLSSKVGRNDACPCGSGKKFKKCHGAG